MPPKSASVGWPLRRSARKSIPNDFPTPVYSPLSSSSSTDNATAVGTSSSTAIPTTPEPSRKTLAVYSPRTEIDLEELPRPTIYVSPIHTEEDLDTNWSLVKPDLVSINVDADKEKDGGSIEHVAGLENVVSGVEGSRKVKRKIVRKTVRVVKKVIKRRVPKRVLINGSENHGVAKKAENGMNLTAVSDSNLVNDVVVKSNLLDKKTDESSLIGGVEEIGKPAADDATQNSNPANDVIEKCNNVTEIAKILNVVDEVKETLRKFDDISHVSETIIGGKGSDQAVVDSMEMETSKISCRASVSEQVIGEEGNDLNSTDFVEAKTSSINVEPYVLEQLVGANQSIYMKTNNMKSNVVRAEVENESTNSVEVELVNCASISTTENLRAEEIQDSAMKNSLEDSIMENKNAGIVCKKDVCLVPCQNVGPVEMNNVVLFEGNNVGLNEGLLLSGEMEALERKKRRKTEIFVGGLDKDTKEDDISKALEEAGAITEVRLMMSNAKGKNRKFAFVRFATAADAKNALAKYSKVEICGTECHTELVQGNDTIFLGNIDRKWKTEDVVHLLETAGIEKIDKVTVKADPNNSQRNRGFAFVEFETSRDAKKAFSKLQKKNLLGNNLKIRVAWAQPLIEPAEEDILKMKSVYAEYLPSSWNERRVKEYFKKFGEIENLVLAKDLPSSKRTDFAFINYTTRDAALACIEAVSKERSEDNGSQVKITVSLAKPVSMSKQTKHASDLTKKQQSKEKPKVSKATIERHELNNGKPVSFSYDHAKVDTNYSTTEELVHLLRQQASSNAIPPCPIPATIIQDDHFPFPGSKRQFQGHDPLYMEPRGLPRARVENSYPVSGPSALSHGIRMTSFPYHRQGPSFKSESVRGKNNYPSHFQSREPTPYHGSNMYHRY